MSALPGPRFRTDHGQAGSNPKVRLADDPPGIHGVAHLYGLPATCFCANARAHSLVWNGVANMEVEASRGYVQISVVVVLLGVLGAISGAESRFSVPANEHAVIVDNIGTYGRKISTKSPLAQKFFDQGLRLVYGYYFPEAIASFEEAQQYDPDHPMLDWGLALAMGPNPNSRKNSFPDDPHGDGKKAMANARAHLTRATPAERALIEALSVRYDAEQYPDRAVRDEKFIAATKSVLDRFPDDMEAQFLFADAVMIRGAWQYWRRDGSPLPGTNEAAAALEHILALDPNHPGAVHLYVHLFEASAEPERALPHADRLESTMPKAGHMVHMPSHIYVRLGQYEKAVASNERSVAADHFFLSQWGDLPFPQEGTYHTSASTHAPHALDVLRQAAMLQGNYARALEAAHRMAGGHSLMAANPRQQRLPPAWLVHKAFGRWQALLAEPVPLADRLYLNAAWRYFRGSSFAGLGDFEKADSELQALSAIARDPALKDIVSGANSAPSLVSMLTSALTGEIAMRRGRYAEAVTAFEQAVDAQDALNYDEPPDWLQPMRLYLGAALLKAGRAKDAEAVYREELQGFHDNGWALFGLWQSVRAQGRTAEAEEIRARFERAWKNADVTLTESVF
jgi:tetratricopeptide (TPR) repeat protein